MMISTLSLTLQNSIAQEIENDPWEQYRPPNMKVPLNIFEN